MSSGSGFLADPTVRVLIALLSAGAAAALLAAAFLARNAGRARVARRLATAALAIVTLYAVTLIAVSAASRERELAPGERYTFTGFYPDPHLHARVRSTRLERRLGPPGNQVAARGVFAIVSLEISSDARGSVQRPNRMRAIVVDQRGRRHRRSLRGEAALASTAGDLGALDQTIQPRESYTRDVVFDLPDGTIRPRLRLWEGLWIDTLLELALVGDDNSVGHAPTSLVLGTERF